MIRKWEINKILILCMTIVMVFSVCTAGMVFAADDLPSFVISSHTVSPGDEVIVSIDIQKFENVQGFIIKFTYDKNILSIVNDNDLIFNTDVKNGFQNMVNIDRENGKVMIECYSSGIPPLPNADNMTIATVKFKVSSNASAGTYPISFFDSSLSVGEADQFPIAQKINKVNGLITIPGSNPGGGGGSSTTPTPTPTPTATPVITPTPSPSSAPASFVDVTDSHWAKEYITKLAELNIVSGVGDGYFQPDRNITREEFTKLIVSAFDLVDDTAECDFSDVSKTDWFYKYVASAKKCGIINGVGDGSFGVGTNISRQDMAAIAYRAASYKNIQLTNKADPIVFADESQIADYAKDSVKAMQTAGIISGMGNNLFEPGGLATRAQASKIIYILKF